MASHNVYGQQAKKFFFVVGMLNTKSGFKNKNY